MTVKENFRHMILMIALSVGIDVKVRTIVVIFQSLTWVQTLIRSFCR